MEEEVREGLGRVGEDTRAELKEDVTPAALLKWLLAPRALLSSAAFPPQKAAVFWSPN